MFVGRITKEIEDVSRFTVDLTEWLDEGETATNILSHSITLGTTGWSNTPFPVPGSNAPYDPTPLLFSLVNLVDNGTAVEVYVSYGTPGNVYTCQFEIIGTTLREVNFEVGVQISGQPPAVPPIVTRPIPLDSLSIYGGTMLGPLYLYEDPAYPTEAATKQYVDYADSLIRHVSDEKVNRAGDIMAGFLQLSSDPVQPLQAATKNYVDSKTGSTLADAPSDAFYYGRHTLTWAKVTEEAPLDTMGYLRSNGAWVRGVPQIGINTDVRVTDEGGANIPALTGLQTAFSPGTDVFNLAVRRTGTGGLGDGGVVSLFGPSSTTLPNGVAIITGPRTSAAKAFSFGADGSLSTPGGIFAVGGIQSQSGRTSARTTDGTIPSVFAWDNLHNVASGFWINSTGMLGLGATDGFGYPQATWLTITSTGMSTTSLTTSANVSVGTSLSVGTSFSVGTSIAAASAAFSGTVTANAVVANSIGSATSIAANGTVSGKTLFASDSLSVTNDAIVNRNMQVVGTFTCATLNATTFTTSGDINGGRLISNGGSTEAISGFAYTTTGPLAFSGNLFPIGIQAAGGGYVKATGFAASSDGRLKFDITDITAETGLHWLASTKPVTYRKRWRYDAPDTEATFEAGFIAQDQVRAGYGALVATIEDATMPELVDGDMVSRAGTVLALDMRNQVALLTAACKQLLARIQVLEGTR